MKLWKIVLGVSLCSEFCVATALAQVGQATSEATTIWQMPDADKTRWLHTFKTLTNLDDWKVSVERNDFVIESVKPVAFQNHMVGLPLNSKQHSRKSEEVLRVTLRFSPRMEMKEWQRIRTENEAAATADHALKRKYKINQKFDQFWVVGENAKARADSYRVEARKLKHSLLPQFFALDASVAAFESRHFLSRIDTNVESGQKAAEVLDKIRSLFGIYDERATSHRWFAHSDETKTQTFYPVEVRVVGE